MALFHMQPALPRQSAVAEKESVEKLKEVIVHRRSEVETHLFPFVRATDVYASVAKSREHRGASRSESGRKFGRARSSDVAFNK